MAASRDVIENRFRRGSNIFFWIAGLSALGTTALYHGWVSRLIESICLATPMVVDILLRATPPRFDSPQIHYYCWIFSLICATVFLLLGILIKYGSHTGSFLKLGSLFKGFARIGAWIGLAHLIGSRLFYFAGIVLYTLDGAFAFVLENLLGNRFTELHLSVLLNLGFHFLMLCQLLYGFARGMQSELPPTASETTTKE